LSIYEISLIIYEENSFDFCEDNSFDFL